MEGVDRLAVVVAQELEVGGLAGVLADDAGEVGVGDRGPQHHVGRQRVVGGLAPLLDRGEADDDVGVGPLRPDVGRRLRLPAGHLGDHLVFGVAPLGDVALHLPPSGG